MYICLHCNYKTDAPAKFCPNCGQPMAVIQQEPAQPVYSPAAAYATPAHTGPEVSTAKKITGMVLGIAGLVLAVIAVLYAMLGVLYDEMDSFSYSYGYGYSYNYNSVTDGLSEIMFILTVIFAVAGLALSIVGIIISATSGADGRKLGFSKTGKICGIIGAILNVICLVVLACALA